MTDPELIEAIRTAVTEAMSGEARRALPTHQAMTAEWRLVVTSADGESVPFDARSEADALERAEHFTHRPWQIERRLVSAWTVVPLPAPLDADDGPDGDDGGD